MKDCCVASVFYNPSEKEIMEFYKWYNFMGVKNIYILDNGSKKPIDGAVIKQERTHHRTALQILWKWVTETVKEEYVICCDIDEFLFLDNPISLSFLECVNEGIPLAFSWKLFCENCEKDLNHDVHSAFMYTQCFKEPTIKTICRVKSLDYVNGASHYPCDLRMRRSDYDPRGTLYTADGHKTFMENHLNPKHITWENGWFLHLRVRSQEDWDRKIELCKGGEFNHYTDDQYAHLLEKMDSDGMIDCSHLKWMQVMRSEY